MALPRRGAIQRKGTNTNNSLDQQSHTSASINRQRPALSCRRNLLGLPIGDLQEVGVRERLQERKDMVLAGRTFDGVFREQLVHHFGHGARLGDEHPYAAADAVHAVVGPVDDAHERGLPFDVSADQF